MNFLFSITIGLILFGCVSAATIVKDEPSLKEKFAFYEPVDFDFDVNHVVRVRPCAKRAKLGERSCS